MALCITFYYRYWTRKRHVGERGSKKLATWDGTRRSFTADAEFEMIFSCQHQSPHIFLKSYIKTSFFIFFVPSSLSFQSQFFKKQCPTFASILPKSLKKTYLLVRCFCALVVEVVSVEQWQLQWWSTVLMLWLSVEGKPTILDTLPHLISPNLSFSSSKDKLEKAAEEMRQETGGQIM